MYIITIEIKMDSLTPKIVSRLHRLLIEWSRLIYEQFVRQKLNLPNIFTDTNSWISKYIIFQIK